MGATLHEDWQKLRHDQLKDPVFSLPDDIETVIEELTVFAVLLTVQKVHGVGSIKRFYLDHLC